MTLLARLTLLTLIAVTALPSRGQTAPEPTDLITWDLTRQAMLDLRQQTEPDATDYEIITTILEIALEQSPDDASLRRRLIEAYRAAGDEQAVMAQTRELIRVDPEDTVAQLRYLSWNVSQKQTVEERLALYQRYLDEDRFKQAFDPSVRSRLALDAALLQREQGNNTEFVRLLAMAVSLDSSNKEAAALTSAFYQERRDDPVAILELAINLLRSDPVDPNLYFGVAAELAEHGVFDQAQRFHGNARRLIATDGVTGDSGIEIETTVLLWHNNGAQALLDEYEQYLQLQKEAAKLRVDQLEEAGQTTEGVLTPDEVRLPPHIERIRILAAAASGDQVILERAMLDQFKTVEPAIAEITDRLATPEGQNNAELRNELLRQVAAISSELIVSRLIVGQMNEAQLNETKQLRLLLGSGASPQLAVIDGFITLRSGDLDAALAEMEPLAEESTLGSVGYGIALLEAGRNDEAAEAFKRTALFSPVSPIGAYARTRYEAITGNALVYSEHTDAMRGVAQAVPSWFDRAAGIPERMLSMTLTLESQRIGAYERPVILLNLRNISPIALAVGSDRPVNSRFMVSPSMRIGSDLVTSALSPEVIDLHQRLRLMPGEGISIRIWPDPGFSGWLSNVKSGHMIRSRWNLLQGFQVGRGQLYSAGPMCLSGEAPLLTIEPDARVRSSLTDIARELEIRDENRMIALLPSVRAAMVDPDRPGGPPPPSEIELIARTVAQRYPALSNEARLAVVALMPHSYMAPGMRTLDETVLAETDPTILAAAIFTRARTPDHPALSRAAASENARLSSLAKRLQERLKDAEPKGFAFILAVGSHRPAAPTHPEAIEP
ncbi:MAG: hypothetical protein ED559_09725 [Phycisphaera sp.]|nr:MAG: hypothetical protein ED559_09725 [Phycisphaera sp.]